MHLCCNLYYIKLGQSTLSLKSEAIFQNPGSVVSRLLDRRFVSRISLFARYFSLPRNVWTRSRAKGIYHLMNAVFLSAAKMAGT